MYTNEILVKVFVCTPFSGKYFVSRYHGPSKDNLQNIYYNALYYAKIWKQSYLTQLDF